MDIQDKLPIELPTKDTNLTPLFFLFVLVPTLLGVAHHVDHVVRGNHVGWPVTDHVNEFTFSLAIYPLLAASLLLSRYKRVAARYWAGFFALNAAVLAYFHVSPWAIEPPQDVIGPYANPAFGYLAFVVLLALIASVVVGSAYAATLYRRSAA
jgi:hypothetical protein